MHALSAVRLWIPRELHVSEGRSAVALALRAALREFDGALPLLDPVEHMKLDDRPASPLRPIPR